jgi:Putative Actinobacterial Holin-X, holin superfamily III
VTDGEFSQASGAGQPSGTGQRTGPAPQTTPPGANGAKTPEDMSVGELVFEVSDRASVLIREEIELAKTEVTEKVNRLLRGSVAGLAAGIFGLLGLLLIMHGVAWLLNDLVFNNFWAGFFVEAGLFLLIGAGAGLFAWRAFKRAAPPTPDMAIEEAKEIKAAFDGDHEKEEES